MADSPDSPLATLPPIAREAVQRALDRIAEKTPIADGYTVGETTQFEAPIAFLPAHKVDGGTALSWCQTDSWTALRGSEGEPEMLAVLRGGSKFEVLELRFEDYSSEFGHFITCRGIINGVERPETPAEVKMERAEEYVPGTHPSIGDDFDGWKVANYFATKYRPDHQKRFRLDVVPYPAKYNQCWRDHKLPPRWLTFTLKSPIETLYLKIKTIDAQKASEDEAAPRDPIGMPIRTASGRPPAFPEATAPDYTGGYLETNGVEGWICVGSRLREPPAVETARIGGDPPDPEAGESYHFTTDGFYRPPRDEPHEG